MASSQKFHHHPCPIPFEDRCESVNRNIILNCKGKQKRRKGLRVLCKLMIQIGGRLSEIATVTKSHIKAK
eukprot:273906-Ditylum_brightwellii.AAC.1